MSLPFDPHGSELLDVFFGSAEELLQKMNEAGLALEENPSDLDQLRHVRRAVHTLKGDSAACGFRELSELAHTLEDVLTPELAAEKAGAVAEVVLSAADTFGEILEAHRKSSIPPRGDALRERIQSLLSKPVPPPAPPPSGPKFEWTEYERLSIGEACRRGESVYQIALRLDSAVPLTASDLELVREALEAAGKVLALHPREVKASEKIRFIEAALLSSQPIDAIKQQCHVPPIVENLSINTVDVPRATQGERDALQILIEAEAAALSATVKTSSDDASGRQKAMKLATAPSAVHNAVESTLRVDTSRIDSVMNLVGELIIGKSMLHRAITEFERRYARDPVCAKISDAVAFQSRVLRELQKSVMAIRMVPVEQLFRRFPRLVRDLARSLDKEIDLEVAGENTDLDKSVLDALSEPLAHLVRNAADHGIETAAERQILGKSARGTLRLNAYHNGDQVVIEISDNGRGLDREKIIRSAVERGIVTATEALRLTESEILQLIFKSGFSTAKEVTEISGRGVGLEVVKSVLENLKGTIEVNSEKGRGSTFRMFVPLTLATIQALLFRAQGRLYAVPLSAVIEITRLTPEDIHHVDDREVFRLREQVLTLVRLDQFGAPGMGERSKRMFVAIVRANSRRFGLLVDSLIGEEELVIKALEDQLIASPLVSGASILGDGTVVLILNVAAVVSHLSKAEPLGATA